MMCSIAQPRPLSLGAAPVADRTGRKPAIYAAVTVMALVYIGYCFVDTYEWVVLLGVLYGAGNGVYIAVDYALAVDCLPSQVLLPPPPLSLAPPRPRWYLLLIKACVARSFS